MVEFCLSFADSGLLSLKVCKDMRTHEPKLLDGVLCLMRLALCVDLCRPVLNANFEEATTASPPACEARFARW